MIPALHVQWLRLEKLKQYYEQAILEARPDQQQFKAEQSSWNMLQVMEHLMMAEKLSMDYLIAKKYTNARRGGNISAFFRSLGLRFMLLSPLRFRAPRSLPEPTENADPAGLLQQWKQSREAMYEYLHYFPEEKLFMMIYRHPRAGWLTIHQALKFFEDHMLHHQKQLLRIRQAAGFPS